MKHDHSFIPRVFLFKYDGAPESNHHHHSSDGATIYHNHDATSDHDHHVAHRDAWLYDDDVTYIYGPADHAHVV